MSMAFMFQNCAEIPKPKIFSELSEEEAEKKLQSLVNQVLNGDIKLLKKLQDLPYLNPKFRLKH